jgi:hypothetical protein
MADDSAKKKSSSKGHRAGGDVNDDEPALEGYERSVESCFLVLGFRKLASNVSFVS